MNKTRFVLSMVAGVMMILGMSSDAQAKKGFYFGLGVPYNTIEGDFDGSSLLNNGTEVIILPEIDASPGFGVLFGYGINQEWAVELNMLGSTHDGNWPGWPGFAGDVDYFSFSINGKYNFSPSEATQPYLLFGVSGNSLLIHDGSRDSSTGEVGDGVLSGSGFNIGGGIEHYFKKMSARLGVTYRFITYTNAEGVQNNGAIDDSVDGSGLTFMLSTAYHF